MRILFDQGVPAPLRHSVSSHEVATCFELGWSALRNGELLEAAEAASFQVFVTTDQNLRYQQNLSARAISIIVLRTTSWPLMQGHLSTIVEAIERAVAGGYREVAIPLAR